MNRVSRSLDKAIPFECRYDGLLRVFSDARRCRVAVLLPQQPQLNRVTTISEDCMLVAWDY